MEKDINEFDKGLVYVRDKFAGIIEKSNMGFKFTYDNNYLNEESIPVSLTLPLREEPYESVMLFPFFDGLIPEGYILTKILDNWKLNVRDRFELLLVSCNDCIGKVSVRRA